MRPPRTCRLRRQVSHLHGLAEDVPERQRLSGCKKRHHAMLARKLGGVGFDGCSCSGLVTGASVSLWRDVAGCNRLICTSHAGAGCCADAAECLEAGCAVGDIGGARWAGRRGVSGRQGVRLGANGWQQVRRRQDMQRQRGWPRQGVCPRAAASTGRRWLAGDGSQHLQRSQDGLQAGSALLAAPANRVHCLGCCPRRRRVGTARTWPIGEPAGQARRLAHVGAWHGGCCALRCGAGCSADAGRVRLGIQGAWRSAASAGAQRGAGWQLCDWRSRCALHRSGGGGGGRWLPRLGLLLSRAAGWLHRQEVQASLLGRGEGLLQGRAARGRSLLSGTWAALERLVSPTRQPRPPWTVAWTAARRGRSCRRQGA